MSGSSASPELAVARGDVEHRDLARGERLAEDADDARAHHVGELVEPEMIVRARDFLQELRRIDDAEIVCPERAHPDDAEILVAHHHRIRRAPLVAREQARGQEVDVRLERRLEAVFPALESA